MRLPQLRTLLLSAVLVAACTAADTGSNDSAAGELLQRNQQLIQGGQRRTEPRTTEKVLTISEGGYTLLGWYRASSDGRMRIDVFADGERVYSEGNDANGAWEWPGGEAAPENVDHEGAGALQHGIEFNLFALAELPSRGHTVESIGEETVRGIRYHVFKVTLADGFITYKYLNPETALVELSRNLRALHPGTDPEQKAIETRTDDWQRSDGILYPRRSRFRRWRRRGNANSRHPVVEL